MLLDRALGDAEHVGYLLVGPAAHYERKYLALAWCQAFIASATLPLLLLGGVPSHCALHRFEQLIPRNWLGEEIHCASLHRAHRGGNIAVGREKDHRQSFFGLSERFLQLQTAESRHLQVEHRAAGGLRRGAVEELLRRTKGFDLIICSPETARQSTEKRGVVIHQIDDRRAMRLALALGRAEGLVAHAVISSLRCLAGMAKMYWHLSSSASNFCPPLIGKVLPRIGITVRVRDQEGRSFVANPFENASHVVVGRSKLPRASQNTFQNVRLSCSMSWITIVWSMVASSCLTLATVHAVIWLRQSDQRAHLLFSVTATSVAAIAACELLAMRAQSPEQFGEVVWWVHLPLFFLAVSIVGFIRLYFSAGRPWLGYAACGLRLLDLIINSFSMPNANYKLITGLRHVTLGGETISIAQGVENPWVKVSELSSLLLLIFVVDASITLWRRGHRSERRRAVVVGGSMTFFILMAAGHSALVEAGLIQSAYLISLSFLPIVAAMGYELGSDVVRAASLARQLQASETALRESEQQMRLAASAGELAMWTWDIPRNEIWTTNKGRALYGLAHSEKINFKRFLDTLHPEDRDAGREALAEAVNGALDYEREYRVVLPTGETRWIAARGRVELDGNKPVRMRGVSRDITLRKQAEERFQLVVEAAPNAMVMTNAEGKIVLVNAQVEAVFGYTRQDLVGRPVEMLVPERFRFQHPQDRIGYFADPKARAMGAGRELLGRRKDGSEVPVEIGLNPIHSSEGLFVLASIIDLTQRREAELEAARQRNELAHLSRVTLLGELAGSMAHELNQPLGAIQSNAEAAEILLKKHPPDLDELGAILSDIRQDGWRASEVINRMRSLLKKGAAKLEPLDINEVVESVLKLVRSDLVHHNVAVDAQLAAHLPAVNGDDVQLQQVLLNLVVNGCDAMAGVEPIERRLLVRTELADDREVLVSVTDQGCGIPPEKIDHIFEPFFTTKTHGMGLGLAVCRTIISAHGGKLWATNNARRGATFHFALRANERGTE
jgi:two-component system, LuxR family, sensor kinase FixL